MYTFTVSFRGESYTKTYNYNPLAKITNHLRYLARKHRQSAEATGIVGQLIITYTVSPNWDGSLSIMQDSSLLPVPVTLGGDA